MVARKELYICPTCKIKNDENQKYCTGCGTWLLSERFPAVKYKTGQIDRLYICSFCDTANEPGRNACKKCFKPLFSTEYETKEIKVTRSNWFFKILRVVTYTLTLILALCGLLAFIFAPSNKLLAILVTLLLISFIQLLFGLINPIIVLGKFNKRSKILGTYGTSLVVLFIVTVVIVQQGNNVNPTKAVTTIAEATSKAKEVENDKNPKWNLKELLADKNGNIALAIKMMKAMGDLPEGNNAEAGDVLKTPWNYYGKPIKFTGTIGIVQDYPPDSDFSKGGILSQIVFTTADGTIVDLFSTVASGKLKVGNQVTVVAFPVGQVEVANKLGGKTTQLAVVTNKVE